jgi:hypothetical protein
MTKAERLQAQLEALEELLERAARRSSTTSWLEAVEDMRDDVARGLKLARREESRAKGLAGQVATAQQPA